MLKKVTVVVAVESFFFQSFQEWPSQTIFKQTLYTAMTGLTQMVTRAILGDKGKL